MCETIDQEGVIYSAKIINPKQITTVRNNITALRPVWFIVQK